ncbi:hypothetical protein IAT38_001987 [Cryptococcus sp. DSM 104549]
MLWQALLPLLLPLSAASPLRPRQNASSEATPTYSLVPSSTTVPSSSAAVAASSALASPSSSASSPANSTGTDTGAYAPTVTIYPDTSEGQPIVISGVRQSSIGQDLYLGIPFAQPPVGDLRFTPPQPVTYNTTFTAQKNPPGCPQAPTATSGYYPYGLSEDCLYLNVFAPEGANGTTAWLPVMVFIYGGSFTGGSASVYNGSGIVAHGLQTGKPFIYVVLNYRLGALGWGAGSGFAENNAANLGLRDIKQGLGWVKENIWAFGGNPDQVTVFGESAGAIAISLLYLDPEVDLFKSAIMESGAQSTLPIGPTNTTWDDAYKALLEAANCSVTITLTTPFECLRNLDVERLLEAQLLVKNQTQFAGFVYGPTIDGDLIPDSPHTLIAEGKFAKKPFITGNNKDEGTAFVPAIVNTTLFGLGFVDIVEPNKPSNETLLQVVGLYPAGDPSLNSPFDTGNETFGRTTAWKQAAAYFGDATFQANRRHFLRNANNYGFNQTWTYQFEQNTPGAAGYLGVYHGSEIPYVFAIARPDAGSEIFSSNYTEADGALSDTIMDYWINFAYYTDPNGESSDSSNATYWPAHDYTQNTNILRLKAGNISVFEDTYREEQMQFFLENPQQFNYRRSLFG